MGINVAVEWELRILDENGDIESQFEGLETRGQALVTATREVEVGQRFQIIAWSDDGSESVADDSVRKGSA